MGTGTIGNVLSGVINFEGAQLDKKSIRSIAALFKSLEGRTLVFNRHDDIKSFDAPAKVKVVKSYENFAVLSKFGEFGDEQFTTCINYASLLDRQNQHDRYVWQLEYI